MQIQAVFASLLAPLDEKIIRTFIADADSTQKAEVRFAYGKLSGIVGISVNLLLCTIKLLLGLFSGAVSVVADALHNLADAAASVATLLGFRLAAKPADAEHPFGHGRIEYLAGFGIACAILMIGAKLLETSIEKIITPEELSADVDMLLILVSTIALQLWLGHFNMLLGRRIDSTAIKAAAMDSRSDSLATIFVLLSLAMHYFFSVNVDGYAGVIVAGFILHSGWEAARDTLQPLLGRPPDKALVDELRREVLSEPAIQGMHDLLVHDYGPGRIYISLHAEIPATMDVMEAHEVIDDLETRLRKRFGVLVTVHMDPIAVDDPETKRYKGIVEELVKREQLGRSIHDFRLTYIRGGRVRLIFDLVVEPTNRMTDENIGFFLRHALEKVHPEVELIVTVDRYFTSS